MTMIDLKQIATAAVGALLFSTVCISAAVAQARDVNPDMSYQLAAASPSIWDEARA